jgi:hypothetical protein
MISLSVERGISVQPKEFCVKRGILLVREFCRKRRLLLPLVLLLLFLLVGATSSSTFIVHAKQAHPQDVHDTEADHETLKPVLSELKPYLCKAMTLLLCCFFNKK